VTKFRRDQIHLAPHLGLYHQSKCGPSRQNCPIPCSYARDTSNLSEQGTASGCIQQEEAGEGLSVTSVGTCSRPAPYPGNTSLCCEETPLGFIPHSIGVGDFPDRQFVSNSGYLLVIVGATAKNQALRWRDGNRRPPGAWPLNSHKS
jgi:hypothetical protein